VIVFANSSRYYIYGKQKIAKDQRADDILTLMKKNEALRVAYVDEVHHQGYTQYYSVLVKLDQDLQRGFLRYIELGYQVY
jgi:hypothetical protein